LPALAECYFEFFIGVMDARPILRGEPKIGRLTVIVNVDSGLAIQCLAEFVSDIIAVDVAFRDFSEPVCRASLLFGAFFQAAQHRRPNQWQDVSEVPFRLRPAVESWAFP